MLQTSSRSGDTKKKDNRIDRTRLKGSLTERAQSDIGRNRISMIPKREIRWQTWIVVLKMLLVSYAIRSVSRINEKNKLW